VQASQGYRVLCGCGENCWGDGGRARTVYELHELVHHAGLPVVNALRQHPREKSRRQSSSRGVPGDGGRGLHSSTFQLNLSALYGTGGARKGCVARVKGVFWVCRVFSYVRHGSR